MRDLRTYPITYPEIEACLTAIADALRLEG